jgi:hypothetical protein
LDAVVVVGLADRAAWPHAAAEIATTVIAVARNTRRVDRGRGRDDRPIVGVEPDAFMCTNLLRLAATHARSSIISYRRAVFEQYIDAVSMARVNAPARTSR